MISYYFQSPITWWRALLTVSSLHMWITFLLSYYSHHHLVRPPTPTTPMLYSKWLESVLIFIHITDAVHQLNIKHRITYQSRPLLPTAIKTPQEIETRATTVTLAGRHTWQRQEWLPFFCSTSSHQGCQLLRLLPMLLKTSLLIFFSLWFYLNTSFLIFVTCYIYLQLSIHLKSYSGFQRYFQIMYVFIHIFLITSQQRFGQGCNFSSV